jgi:drug/metabolite transporter (DMT)-like permease
LKNQWINWILFLLLCVTWGSSFVIMKEGLRLLSAWQVASVRIISAGAVLIPFGWQSFRRIPSNKWGLIFLSGLLGTFFPAFLFCDSSLAGIMNALTPIFTLLIGVTAFAQRIPLLKWIGVGIGFVGLVLLILSGDQGISLEHTGYASFVLIATLLYGINVQMVNRYLNDIPSRDIATIAFTLLVIPSFIILTLTGFFSAPDSVILSTSTLASAMLGVIGTAIASIVFYMLLKRAGPLFASMVTYGIPFVALFWGLLAGESINEWQVLCLVTILFGVFLANK